MRKLLMFILVIILLVCALGAYGFYYVRPDPALTLEYQSVSLKDKALDMVKRMSPEMLLTEEDINHLLKQALAQHPRQNPDVEVLGAQFTLLGNQLNANLRLLWKGRVTAGLQVSYILSWSEPNMTAKVESVRLKGIKLSTDLTQDLVIPLGQELPALIHIKDIAFDEHEIAVRFKLK